MLPAVDLSLYHFAEVAPVDRRVARMSSDVAPQEQSSEESRSVVELPSSGSALTAPLAGEDQNDQEQDVLHFGVERACRPHVDGYRTPHLLVCWKQEVQAYRAAWEYQFHVVPCVSRFCGYQCRIGKRSRIGESCLEGFTHLIL